MLSESDPVLAPSAPAQAEPPAPPPICHLALYKPGSRVRWQGRPMAISHVLLRRGRLLVFLDGHPDPVEPESLDMPLTRLVMARR